MQVHIPVCDFLEARGQCWLLFSVALDLILLRHALLLTFKLAFLGFADSPCASPVLTFLSAGCTQDQTIYGRCHSNLVSWLPSKCSYPQNHLFRP